MLNLEPSLFLPPDGKARIKNMIVGIDLGTTNSVGAYMDHEGPKLIPNVLGEYLTPSVVGVDRDGNVLVGKAAKEYQVLEPERCVSLFKRFMG